MDRIGPQLSGTPALLRMIPIPVGPSTSFTSDPLLLPKAGCRITPPASGSPGPDEASVRFVVEPEVFPQLPVCFNAIGIGFQVHLLILHRPPQPLHEDVVPVPPLPVRADPHAPTLEDLGELQADELAPLVGVEHLRLALAQGLFQCFGAEASLQGVGNYRLDTPNALLPDVVLTPKAPTPTPR